MSQPLVTIVTPTYAKPRHFAECAAAVLAQIFTDWVWWPVINAEQWPQGYYIAMDQLWRDPRIVPIWYPVSDDDRKHAHIPTRIVNWLYPKVQTPYIYFLADDDLIDPKGLATLVPELMRYSEIADGRYYHPRDAVYGRCDVVSEQPDGTYAHVNWLHPGATAACLDNSEWDIGLDTGVQPDCLIDGGQVLHTKALWDRATADGWQNDDNPAVESAGHADGRLLNRLAQFARFHYVPQRIVTHRRTSLSTFLKPMVMP